MGVLDKSEENREERTGKPGKTVGDCRTEESTGTSLEEEGSL